METTFSVAFLRGFLVWVTCNLVIFCNLQYCPDESSTHIDRVIKWHTQNPGEVISVPPCINDNYEISKRICHTNRTWQPRLPPKCKLVQESFHRMCPPEFIQNGNYCLFINKKVNGDFQCPFPTFLDITEAKILKNLVVFNLSNIWLPVKRYQSYGKFVYTIPKFLYRRFTHKQLEASKYKENFTNNCIIFPRISADKNIKIVKCTSLYNQICIYKVQDTISINNGIIACSFNKGNKCYNFITDLDESCDKLAEPVTQDENYIIKNYIPDCDCRIGMEKKENGIYHWLAYKPPPSFTDWKLNIHFNKSLVTISKQGWNLQHENIHCQVCEINLEKKQIGITLRVNHNRKSLILTLYSPEVFINKNKLTCNAVGVGNHFITFTAKKIPKHIYQNGILNKISMKDNRQVYFLKPNTEEYNYYKCEGVVLPNASLLSTEYVLFGTIERENEYSLHILIKNCTHSFFICIPKWHNSMWNVIKNKNFNFIDNFRVIKILEVQNDSLEMILHIRLDTNDLTVVEEYKKVLNFSLYISAILNMRLVSVRYSWGCLEDVTDIDGTILHWKFANLGETIMPKELCMDFDGLPVTRKCSGNFIEGGKWERASGVCFESLKHSWITYKLYEMYSSYSSIEEAIQLLKNLTKYTNQLIPSDIYYISKIIQKTDTKLIDFYLAKSFITIISNLMSVNKDVLKSSNNLLNTTNLLLDTFEEVMKEIQKLQINGTGFVQFISPNLYYQISDLFLCSYTGVIMSKRLDFPKDFHDYNFEPLLSDTNIEYMIESDLEVATFIPESIINEVKNSTKYTRVFIAIFANNSLFQEDAQSIQSFGSKIISVSLSNEAILSSPIPVVFRNKDKGIDKYCSYWSFGRNAYETTYPSQWSTDGAIYWNSTIPEIDICAFTHLTHFALLLVSPFKTGENRNFDYDHHDRVLSIITIIGCALSIFGISVIMLTAILFKSWRKQLGTKILLHFACSSLLEMMVIFLADSKNIERSNTTCMIFGIILHYSVISSFCWMLVVGFLQYLRFVKVFGGVPSHLLIKSCMIGWLLPVIPVVILLIWDMNSYTPMADIETSSLCYPRDNAMYTAVLLPITIIVIINLVIFCLVIYNVSIKTIQNRNENKHLGFHKFKLAVLLFFLLGLSWIFGILASTKNCLICLYLFCSAATLQGFVLFIFYIILDPAARKLYVCKSKNDAINFIQHYYTTECTRSTNTNTVH